MRILVCYEKHDTRYYDVSTDEILHKACVKILKERLEEGWYKAYEPQTDLGMTAKDIGLLPKGPIKEEVLRLLEVRKEQEKEYEDQKDFIKEVKQAINTPFNPDAKPVIRMTAYHLLERRRDYEYERAHLEDVTTL